MTSSAAAPSRSRFLGAAIGAERFLREIEIAAKLTHPHILPLHDSGEAAGLLYYVMPFVEGESLRARLDREKQLPLEDGQTEEAAEALGPVTGEVPLELVSVPLFATIREFTQEHARHLRIVVLMAQQKPAEALRWIDASFQRAPSEIAYAAPRHLQRAEIYDRLGEREKAAEHYRRFMALWRDCDPALRPRVDEARAQLARLERAGG